MEDYRERDIMISTRELKEIAKRSGLTLYQQEKDYLLKLFLFYYYRMFEDAIFKGGTCIKYIYGLERFSEDLDFNLRGSPKKFQRQVKKIVKKIEDLGMESKFRKQELFTESFTCEINFKGPLFMGKDYSMNKFRIDAGKRTGTILKPKWQVIESEYPETGKSFLVLTMDEKEILAEKIVAMLSRGRGRDLYDVWFLLKRGVEVDEELVEKKCSTKLERVPSRREYENDIKNLVYVKVPYEQVIKEIKEKLSGTRLNIN